MSSPSLSLFSVTLSLLLIFRSIHLPSNSCSVTDYIAVWRVCVFYSFNIFLFSPFFISESVVTVGERWYWDASSIRSIGFICVHIFMYFHGLCISVWVFSSVVIRCTVKSKTLILGLCRVIGFTTVWVDFCDRRMKSWNPCWLPEEYLDCAVLDELMNMHILRSS